MLHVKGFKNGFCLCIGDKDVSVQEALLHNGRPYHKSTINALNRNNLSCVADLANFETVASTLHTGINAVSARQLLLDKFNIDVSVLDYMQLSASQIHDIKRVYDICTYKVTGKNHSPMYYFYQYLNRKGLK